MNSRELVLRTLEFDHPERIARQLWLLPWGVSHFAAEIEEIKRRFPDDIIHAPGFLKMSPKTTGDAFAVGEYVDEWGCTFTNLHAGVIGEVKTPLVQTWDDLGKVRPPEECLTIDVDQVNAFCQETDKFVLAGCCPRPYERLQFVRGTENVMMDLALQEPGITELLDLIHQFYLKELQVWAQTDVDGLVFMDDWGAQQSLLISPAAWREHFAPCYRDYADIARSSGKKLFMHSDGHITEIIGDLIDIGVDALNSQIFCMGVAELGAQFAGEITFWGEIDRQHLLPEGSAEDIAQAVRLVHDSFYRDGGVIAQMELGPGAIGANAITAFETWQQLSAT